MCHLTRFATRNRPTAHASAARPMTECQHRGSSRRCPRRHRTSHQIAGAPQVSASIITGEVDSGIITSARARPPAADDPRQHPERRHRHPVSPAQRTNGNRRRTSRRRSAARRSRDQLLAYRLGQQRRLRSRSWSERSEPTRRCGHAGAGSRREDAHPGHLCAPEGGGQVVVRIRPRRAGRGGGVGWGDGDGPGRPLLSARPAGDDVPGDVESGQRVRGLR